MGSGSSKAAKTAAGAAKRQYPQRIPHNTTTSSTSPTSPGPTVHPKPQASNVRDDAINQDAADPDFARSLRSLGAVKPNPMCSHTSTFDPSQHTSSESGSQQIFPSPTSNPAIQIIDARNRLSQAAEAEFGQTGRKGFQGREFLDVVLIRQALMLRDDKGLSDSEIERQLGLKSGVMARLGRKGIVGDVAMGSDWASSLAR